MRLTYENAPTAQTKVFSFRVRSVLIRSKTLPVRTSHLRKLLSEHPVTIQLSSHVFPLSSSSLSSWSLSDCLWRRRVGGPQAMDKIRHLTRSNFRSNVNSSAWSDTSRMHPSSHPRARWVPDGLAARDQMDPPWDDKNRLTTPLFKSHSKIPLPPLVLNSRNPSREFGEHWLKDSLQVKARESTLDGFGAKKVYILILSVIQWGPDVKCRINLKNLPGLISSLEKNFHVM